MPQAQPTMLRNPARAICAGLLTLALLACQDHNPSAARAAHADECNGPARLQIDRPTLDAALQCSTNLANAQRQPILLVPGTATRPDTVYSWNYIRDFEARGWPHCTLELPEAMLIDIQDSAEYFVRAVRQMHRISGRQVQVIGLSQGGMMPRWGIRYFPDIREMIDDLVTFAASNHGSDIAAPTCTSDCEPAIWQQRVDSQLLQALNAGQETYPDIDYSSIYSRSDEIVRNVGPDPSSPLRDGGDNVVNIALQDICPLNTTEHLGIGTYDAVAYALAIDALDNPGPVDPSRLPGIVAGQPGTAEACATPTHPGVEQMQLAQNFAAVLEEIAVALNEGEHVPAEPPLRCYAR